MGDNTRSFLMLEQVKENEVYQRMPSGAKKGKKPNTVAVVTALAAPVAERMGLTIWDVRFEKEGSSWFLRIFIDKDGKWAYHGRVRGLYPGDEQAPG